MGQPFKKSKRRTTRNQSELVREIIGTTPPAEVASQHAAADVESGQWRDRAASPAALHDGAIPRRRMLGMLRLSLAMSLAALAGCGCLLWLHRRPAGADRPRSDGPGAPAVRLAAQVAQLEAKVAELEGIRELQRHANEAIAGGNRAALYKLDESLRSPASAALKETARAEIIRVESYFVTTKRFRGYPGGLPDVPADDPVPTLAQILLDLDKHWAMRSHAARMLGEHAKNLQAADALAKASDADPSLYVAQEAIIAFAKLTGFRPTAVFDGRSLNEWWAKNRANFE